MPNLRKRAAIFVALTEELRAAKSALESRGEIVGPGIEATASRNLYAFRPFGGTKEILVDLYLFNSMGNISSAAFVANSFLPSGGPEIAILLGISGSLDQSQLGLADVLISNHVKHYHVDKIFDIDDLVESKRASLIPSDMPPEVVADLISKRVNGHFLIDANDTLLNGTSAARYRRGRQLEDGSTNLISTFLYNRSRSEKAHSGGFRVVSGCILGTEYVIDSQHYVEYLRSKNRDSTRDFYWIHEREEYALRCAWDGADIVGVDMESYGFFKALQLAQRRTPVLGIAVRGISDMACGKSELDKKTKGSVRTKAVENAVSVALELLDSYFASTRSVVG